MTERPADRIARKLQLLELEAAVQRATLGATFAQLEEKRALAIGSAVGTGVMRLLAQPKIRWIVLASVLARLRARRERKRERRS